MSKKFTITTLVLLASLGLVVSGCIKKPVAQPVNQNTNANTNVATTTAASSSRALAEEEIDTSNWRTYRNEEYGFEFKYPGEWVVFDYENKLNNLILSMENESFGYPYGSEGDIRFSVRVYKSSLNLKEWFDKEGLYNNYDIQRKINFMQKEVGTDSIDMDDVIINDYDLNFNSHDFIARYVKFLKPEYYEGPAYTHKIYNCKIENYIISFELSSPTSTSSDRLIDRFGKSIIGGINLF
ncbi:MAG: PsbP-related protein [Candidatus Shapirobacteria bacterium]